ncbi:hypothetical protein DOY81_011921 [Sarcophaga bullata]|nr:hypothetical protein DOY81_011921 [Sarcophaga bullata]
MYHWKIFWAIRYKKIRMTKIILPCRTLKKKKQMKNHLIEGVVFTKDSDNDDDSDEDEEIPQAPPIAKKTKKNALGKPVKASNVERIEQIVKRKPLTGGVQKSNKKTLKQPSACIKE